VQLQLHLLVYHNTSGKVILLTFCNRYFVSQNIFFLHSLVNYSAVNLTYIHVKFRNLLPEFNYIEVI
jgi:hypothetical protein